MNFKNKKVAILGYGVEGQDAEKYLVKKGADVSVLDQKFDKDYLKGLDKYDYVVRSPGVYPYKPELKGINLITPSQIFFEEFKGKTIGVTGTKGKGTTSTLIYEILKKAKKDVYLAGNIGKPLLGLLDKLNKNSIVVIEMSSFQLIDLQVSPNISVILNITNDHMDWHKDREEYQKAKENIVKFQKNSDFAVINSEYPASKAFSQKTKANVIFFSKKDLDSKYKKDLMLKGEHNLENIAAAVSVAKILKINDQTIIDTIQSFKGLEHRLEFVNEVRGIEFYNDSFATGPQPTIAAIKSFQRPMTIILGGSDKGLSFKDLQEEIEDNKSVENLILIGEIGEKIGKDIKNKNIINLGKSSMQTVVKKAFEVTPSNGVVILSPAAASFDMFENYKDRGNQFKKEVMKL